MVRISQHSTEYGEVLRISPNLVQMQALFMQCQYLVSNIYIGLKHQTGDIVFHKSFSQKFHLKALLPQRKSIVVFLTQRYIQNLEVAVRRCYVKKVFLKFSQNSQENTCARASFLIKLQV